MTKILNNAIYLVESLFTTAGQLISEEPLQNPDFLNQFKTEEDKEQLDNIVHDLKNDESRNSEELTLSNNRKITIQFK